MDTQNSPIYHEKQSFWLCAKLQKEVYTQEDMDRIANYLHENRPDDGGWLRFNTHKNIFGLGMYDVNVMTAALQEHGYELLWHDNRTDVGHAELDGCLGLIVHIQPEWYMLRRGHWLAIKHFDKPMSIAPVAGEAARTFEPGFWNLDSKLPTPEYIGDRSKLNKHLAKLHQRYRVHVLLVAPA
ncbi:Josephin-1 [Dipsacomyces acuminosporus]|nr:Josephin-1 [Dipsacomyces acuminosporus]